MANNENVEDALYAVHSRLGIIEGKVNLIARAERVKLLQLLEEVVRQDPLIGQIYLLLDDLPTQTEVLDRLRESGIDTSQSTLSRRLTAMETEHGIAEPAQVTNTTTYIRDPAIEKVLNLSKHIRNWLAAEGATIPEQPPRRRRRST